MAADTCIDVWEALSAGNTPRDGSNNGVSGSQGTAWISHASTLSSAGEGADGVVEDAGSVSGRVTVTAVSVGQYGETGPLQVSSGWAWVRGLSPSWSNGVACSEEGTAQSCWCDVGGGCDCARGFNNWNIVGQLVRVVWRMVNDSGDSVACSTGGTADGSNNDDGVSSSASNCAVSGWDYPTGGEQGTSTEMGVSSASQRDHVTELTGSGGWSTNNTARPSLELLGIEEALFGWDCCRLEEVLANRLWPSSLFTYRRRGPMRPNNKKPELSTFSVDCEYSATFLPFYTKTNQLPKALSATPAITKSLSGLRINQTFNELQVFDNSCNVTVWITLMRRK